jgi:hypothetical protein
MIMKQLIAAVCVSIAVLAACGSDKQLDMNAKPADYLKQLAGDGAQVELTEQDDANGKYFAMITVPGPETFWGGAQDWNRFASDVSTITKGAFARNDIVRVRIESDIKTADGKQFGWAYADINKADVPNPKDLTYLELSAYAHLDSGTLWTRQWLCEFYKKYKSAQPNGMLPATCKPD